MDRSRIEAKKHFPWNVSELPFLNEKDACLEPVFDENEETVCFPALFLAWARDEVLCYTERAAIPRTEMR